MSRTMRKKHVMKEMFDDDFDLPKDNQQIVRVLCSRGNNLHEVENENGENFLVSMPNKFRKNMWVKRGDFLLVDPIEEGDKVKAEITRILTAEHIKEFTKNDVWPKKFTKKRELPEDSEKNGDDDDDENMFNVRNVNRKYQQTINDDDDDEDDSSNEESDEEDE